MSNLSTTLWSHIRTVQDFPKPGICFFDLTPLFMKNIGLLTDALIESIPADKLAEVDSFIAVEAIFVSFIVGAISRILKK